ncbi:unnamed protein product [Amoebophrya sp. A25]|nr:unnamed protein product [Amoebophrya sp. A25]|eukprot:GSA25T00024587001.1
MADETDGATGAGASGATDNAPAHELKPAAATTSDNMMGPAPGVVESNIHEPAAEERDEATTAAQEEDGNLCTTTTLKSDDEEQKEHGPRSTQKCSPSDVEEEINVADVVLEAKQEEVEENKKVEHQDDETAVLTEEKEELQDEEEKHVAEHDEEKETSTEQQSTLDHDRSTYKDKSNDHGGRGEMIFVDAHDEASSSSTAAVRTPCSSSPVATSPNPDYREEKTALTKGGESVNEIGEESDANCEVEERVAGDASSSSSAGEAILVEAEHLDQLPASEKQDQAASKKGLQGDEVGDEKMVDVVGEDSTTAIFEEKKVEEAPATAKAILKSETGEADETTAEHKCLDEQPIAKTSSTSSSSATTTPDGTNSNRLGQGTSLVVRPVTAATGTSSSSVLVSSSSSVLDQQVPLAHNGTTNAGGSNIKLVEMKAVEKSPIVLQRRSSPRVGSPPPASLDLLRRIGLRLRKNVDRFVALLEDNWIETLEDLFNVTDTQFLENWKFPLKLVQIIREEERKVNVSAKKQPSTDNLQHGGGNNINKGSAGESHDPSSTAAEMNSQGKNAVVEQAANKNTKSANKTSTLEGCYTSQGVAAKGSELAAEAQALLQNNRSGSSEAGNHGVDFPTLLQVNPNRPDQDGSTRSKSGGSRKSSRLKRKHSNNSLISVAAASMNRTNEGNATLGGGPAVSSSSTAAGVQSRGNAGQLQLQQASSQLQLQQAASSGATSSAVAATTASSSSTSGAGGTTSGAAALRLPPGVRRRRSRESHSFEAFPQMALASDIRSSLSSELHPQCADIISDLSRCITEEVGKDRMCGEAVLEFVVPMRDNNKTITVESQIHGGSSAPPAMITPSHGRRLPLGQVQAVGSSAVTGKLQQQLHLPLFGGGPNGGPGSRIGGPYMNHNGVVVNPHLHGGAAQHYQNMSVAQQQQQMRMHQMAQAHAQQLQQHHIATSARAVGGTHAIVCDRSSMSSSGAGSSTSRKHRRDLKIWDERTRSKARQQELRAYQEQERMEKLEEERRLQLEKEAAPKLSQIKEEGSQASLPAKEARLQRKNRRHARGQEQAAGTTSCTGEKAPSDADKEKLAGENSSEEGMKKDAVASSQDDYVEETGAGKKKKKTKKVAVPAKKKVGLSQQRKRAGAVKSAVEQQVNKNKKKIAAEAEQTTKKGSGTSSGTKKAEKKKSLQTSKIKTNTCSTRKAATSKTVEDEKKPSNELGLSEVDFGCGSVDEGQTEVEEDEEVKAAKEASPTAEKNPAENNPAPSENKADSTSNRSDADAIATGSNVEQPSESSAANEDGGSEAAIFVEEKEGKTKKAEENPASKGRKKSASTNTADTTSKRKISSSKSENIRTMKVEQDAPKPKDSPLATASAATESSSSEQSTAGSLYESPSCVSSVTTSTSRSVSAADSLIAGASPLTLPQSAWSPTTGGSALELVSMANSTSKGVLDGETDHLNGEAPKSCGGNTTTASSSHSSHSHAGGGNTTTASSSHSSHSHQKGLDRLEDAEGGRQRSLSTTSGRVVMRKKSTSAEQVEASTNKRKSKLSSSPKSKKNNKKKSPKRAKATKVEKEHPLGGTSAAGVAGVASRTRSASACSSVAKGSFISGDNNKSSNHDVDDNDSEESSIGRSERGDHQSGREQLQGNADSEDENLGGSDHEDLVKGDQHKDNSSSSSAGAKKRQRANSLDKRKEKKFKREKSPMRPPTDASDAENDSEEEKPVEPRRRTRNQAHQEQLWKRRLFLHNYEYWVLHETERFEELVGTDILPYLKLKNVNDIVCQAPPTPVAPGKQAQAGGGGEHSQVQPSSSSTSTSTSQHNNINNRSSFFTPRHNKTASQQSGTNLTVADFRQLSFRALMTAESAMWGELEQLFDVRSVLYIHLQPIPGHAQKLQLVFPERHFERLPDLEQRVLEVDLPECTWPSLYAGVDKETFDNYWHRFLICPLSLGKKNDIWLHYIARWIREDRAEEQHCAEGHSDISISNTANYPGPLGTSSSSSSSGSSSSMLNNNNGVVPTNYGGGGIGNVEHSSTLESRVAGQPEEAADADGMDSLQERLARMGPGTREEQDLSLQRCLMLHAKLYELQALWFYRTRILNCFENNDPGRSSSQIPSHGGGGELQQSLHLVSTHQMNGDNKITKASSRTQYQQQYSQFEYEQWRMTDYTIKKKLQAGAVRQRVRSAHVSSGSTITSMMSSTTNTVSGQMSHQVSSSTTTATADSGTSLGVVGAAGAGGGGSNINTTNNNTNTSSSMSSSAAGAKPVSSSATGQRGEEGDAAEGTSVATMGNDTHTTSSSGASTTKMAVKKSSAKKKTSENASAEAKSGSAAGRSAPTVTETGGQSKQSVSVETTSKNREPTTSTITAVDSSSKKATPPATGAGGTSTRTSNNKASKRPASKESSTTRKKSADVETALPPPTKSKKTSMKAPAGRPHASSSGSKERKPEKKTRAGSKDSFVAKKSRSGSMNNVNQNSKKSSTTGTSSSKNGYKNTTTSSTSGFPTTSSSSGAHKNSSGGKQVFYKRKVYNLDEVPQADLRPRSGIWNFLDFTEIFGEEDLWTTGLYEYDNASIRWWKRRLGEKLTDIDKFKGALKHHGEYEKFCTKVKQLVTVDMKDKQKSITQVGKLKASKSGKYSTTHPRGSGSIDMDEDLSSLRSVISSNMPSIAGSRGGSKACSSASSSANTSCAASIAGSRPVSRHGSMDLGGVRALTSSPAGRLDIIGGKGGGKAAAFDAAGLAGLVLTDFTGNGFHSGGGGSSGVHVKEGASSSSGSNNKPAASTTNSLILLEEAAEEDSSSLDLSSDSEPDGEVQRSEKGQNVHPSERANCSPTPTSCIFLKGGGRDKGENKGKKKGEKSLLLDHVVNKGMKKGKALTFADLASMKGNSDLCAAMKGKGLNKGGSTSAKDGTSALPHHGHGYRKGDGKGEHGKDGKEGKGGMFYAGKDHPKPSSPSRKDMWNNSGSGNSGTSTTSGMLNMKGSPVVTPSTPTTASGGASSSSYGINYTTVGTSGAALFHGTNNKNKDYTQHNQQYGKSSSSTSTGANPHQSSKSSSSSTGTASTKNSSWMNNYSTSGSGTRWYPVPPKASPKPSPNHGHPYGVRGVPPKASPKGGAKPGFDGDYWQKSGDPAAVAFMNIFGQMKE